MNLTGGWKVRFRTKFWSNVFDAEGDGQHRKVIRPVVIFTAFATFVWVIDQITPSRIDLGIDVAPYEFAGAILGSLLVIRSNAGLDRWWEARKLWGGITKPVEEPGDPGPQQRAG